jgi:hypothetical protein
MVGFPVGHHARGRLVDPHGEDLRVQLDALRAMVVELSADVRMLEQTVRQMHECLRTERVEVGEVRLIDPQGVDVGGLVIDQAGQPTLVLLSGGTEYRYALGVSASGAMLMDVNGTVVLNANWPRGGSN